MCDSGSTPKKRYLLIPAVDETPNVAMTFDQAVEHLREWFESSYAAVGEEYTVKLAEFTDEEFEDLPDV